MELLVNYENQLLNFNFKVNLMLLALTLNTKIVLGIIAFLVLSIYPYAIAKSKYDYNIYNFRNIGVVFGGMVALFFILVISGHYEAFELMFILSGVVILIVLATVFYSTMKNTSFVIALLALLPQIIITILMYLLTKIIYNAIFKSD